MRTETAASEAAGGSGPGSLPPTKVSGAEHGEKAAKKRTNDDISPGGGDVKRRKTKAKEVTVALTPVPPTE